MASPRSHYKTAENYLAAAFDPDSTDSDAFKTLLVSAAEVHALLASAAHFSPNRDAGTGETGETAPTEGA